MKRLANATMHDQIAYKEDFARLGFEVESTPLLREVKGARDAYALACEVIEQTKGKYDGLLIGGRTDVMIYLSILAPINRLELYIAETERIRDANDRFVFRLSGVTKVYVNHPVDMVGAAICADIDTISLWRDNPA